MLTGGIVLSATDVHKTSTTREHAYGAVGVDAHGDCYRYAKAGGSAIAAGKLQKAPSPKTNHHNIAVASAAAVGASQVTVTLGATAATLDEYAGGMLVVNDADGEGVAYRIDSHPAADSAASLVVTLDRPLVEALATTSEVSLHHNTWNGVQESTTQTLGLAGVAVVDIAASAYGWLKTRGIAPVLADETLTIGAWLAGGSSVAGAVEELDDVTAPITEQLVGYATVAGVDTEYRPAMITID